MEWEFVVVAVVVVVAAIAATTVEVVARIYERLTTIVIGLGLTRGVEVQVAYLPMSLYVRGTLGIMQYCCYKVVLIRINLVAAVRLIRGVATDRDWVTVLHEVGHVTHFVLSERRHLAPRVRKEIPAMCRKLDRAFEEVAVIFTSGHKIRARKRFSAILGHKYHHLGQDVEERDYEAAIELYANIFAGVQFGRLFGRLPVIPGLDNVMSPTREYFRWELEEAVYRYPYLGFSANSVMWGAELELAGRTIPTM